MKYPASKTTLKIAAVVAALLTAGAASAIADSITSTDNLITPFGPGSSQSISLNSFDAALTGASLNPADYTLTGVTLDFNETSTALVTVFNFNGQSAAFQASTQALNLTAALALNSTTVSTATSAPVYNGVVNTSSVPYTFGTVGVTATNSGAAFSQTSYAPTAPNSAVTAAGTTFNLPSAQLGQWLSSTPTVTLTINSGGLDSIGTPTSGPGQLSFGGTTSSSGNVTVTYTYEAVPEPSAWALMLGGLGALAFVVRRRFNS